MTSPWTFPALLCCLVVILPLTLGVGAFYLLRLFANRNPVLHVWREPDPENPEIIHRLFDLSMLTRKERKQEKREEAQ
jgi:hypothetical protein